MRVFTLPDMCKSCPCIDAKVLELVNGDKVITCDKMKDCGEIFSHIAGYLLDNGFTHNEGENEE